MSEQETLVTIATFATETEASLARGALEAIGISALVPSEASGTLARPYGRTGEGPAELQVFESDRARAIEELRRLQVANVDRPDEFE